MLWPNEAANIKEILTQLLAVNGGRAWFGTVFAGPEFAVALGVAVGPAASDELVSAAAIQVCIRREWKDHPQKCWLLRLVENIAQNSGNGGIGYIADFNEIVSRLQNRINVLDAIWNDTWVRNGLPFVDRDSLRQSLIDFSRADGRPILRIEGAPDSGKSYTHELLQHASQHGGWEFQVIRVVVEEGADVSVNAFSLAQLIVGELGFDNTLQASGLTDPTVHSIPLLQTWILKNAKASGRHYWLFLDGFRFLKPENSARKLIQGLADKIANDNYRQWLRLLLVDYDEPLARVDEDRVAYDTVPGILAETSAHQAVEDCLRKLYLQLNKPVQPREIHAKAAAVLASIPPHYPWMVELNRVIRAAAKGIRNGS